MAGLGGLKIRHLEALVEVARRGSISGAAAALGRTQPAISRTLRELEQLTGRRLVERSGRGTRLTPAGKVMLGHAGQSLAAARTGLEMLRGTGAEPVTVAVGALPTVAASLMPAAVARFDPLGSARLRVVTGENEYLLGHLRAGDLDMVIGRLPAPSAMQGLNFEPLYRERVALVVAQKHPLARRQTLGGADLAAFTLLVPGPGAIIRPLFERLFTEQGLPLPGKVIETVSDSFGRAYVRDHAAVWVISRGVVAADLRDGSLVELPVDTATTLGAVGLTLRRGEPLSPEVEAFAETLRATAARLHAADTRAGPGEGA
ncbi:MAG: pca operon transcription factor PcaQ [Alphaproteobacteria bacterium]|nr:MAG: pca operon transcription factor PcaQ [Alphaproteobacteria bacterium]